MATEVTPLVRVISGKGSISIPSDFANASDVVLYVDVVREAESVYRNFNTNPPESFFGRFCACVGDYVLYSRQISFDREMFQLFPGDVSDVMQAVKCLERSIYLGLKAVAVIAGGDIILPDPYPLDVYEPQGYVPDNFKFVCYNSTALRLTLKAYQNENCGDNEFPRKQPPPPPDPIDKVPPGTPIDVSPPDEDFPEDTDPFPGDEIEPPPGDFPQGERCVAYRVTVNYDFISGQNFDDFNDFWGEIEGIRVQNVGSGSEVQVNCYGLTNTDCTTLDWYRLTGTGNPDAYTNLTLVSIEPI
jgi:hypothetical protein